MKPKICVMMIFALVGLALATGCTTHVPKPGETIACDSLVQIVEKYEAPMKFPFSNNMMIQRYIRDSNGRVFSVAIAEPYGIPDRNRMWESMPLGVYGIVDTGMMMESALEFIPVNVTRSRPSCPNCCEVVP